MLFRALGTNGLTMQVCFLLERVDYNRLNPSDRIKILHAVESAEYKLLLNALQKKLESPFELVVKCCFQLTVISHLAMS